MGCIQKHKIKILKHWTKLFNTKSAITNQKLIMGPKKDDRRVTF